MKKLIGLIIFVAVLFIGFKMFVKFSDDDIQNINDINTTVLDVRTPEEYKAGHAVGAINVPLATIESESTTLDKNKHYVTYCSQGIRSLLAKKKMEKLGFTNVSSGGTLARVNEFISTTN